MPTSLLSTKLIIPTPGTIRIDRPRLAERLDESLRLGCRLALISAPAGFGKTTLTGTWAAALCASEVRSTPLVAWLSLDGWDNDPVTFWSYVIAALQTQQDGIGKQSLTLFQTGQSPEVEQNLAPLLNELAQIVRPWVLILDDFHLVRHPAIHRSLAFFIDRMPALFHVLLLSRTDPPLPLARLRGRGQLVEIRVNDLRFSVNDAQAFLNTGMGLELDPQAIQSLHSKTEGWIAGLQMAGLTLREAASVHDRPWMEAFIASFSGSNRYILDYLIEEVLNQQPAELQNFLLKTAILDRLCGPLCDALLGEEAARFAAGSQTVLEQLESSNLFIVSLDDQRTWYRYHQLFADLLKKRLYQTHPGSLPELHRRAINWYEHNGLIPNAIEHAFQMKDYAKAAALISQIVEVLWGRGEYVRLLEWMAALPKGEKERYPHLWVFEVSMLITAGKMQEAERRVQEIDQYLSDSLAAAPDQAALLGHVNTLRTYIASFYRDFPAVLEYGRLALDYLTQAGDAGRRSGILLVVANAYLESRDLPSAGRALVEAVVEGKTAGKASMLLTAYANLVMVLYLQGDVKLAGQVCQEGLELVRQNGLEQSPLAANLLIGQGLIDCERHALAAAETVIGEGLAQARERSYLWSIAWGCHALMRLRLAQGDPAGAAAAAQEAEALSAQHQLPEYHRAAISGLKAMAWIQAGETARAEGYLEIQGAGVDGEIPWLHESEYWALARLCLVKGDLAAGADLLERLYQRAEAGNQPLWKLRYLALQALLYRAWEMPAQSRHCLGQGLALAEANGCIQVFLDEGQPMKALLAEAVEGSISPGNFAGMLLQAFEDAGKTGPAPQDAAGEPAGVPAGIPPASRKLSPAGDDALVEPLTGREIEVLRLIAEGYSNKEIGLKLSLSLRTVKFYATNIYAKLNVTGRTQAIHRARELGLL